MSATQKLPSRTGILVRALIILFVGGMVNSAAVFVNPLAEQFSWSTESVAGVITFMATMQTPGHILSGWMLGRVGAKKTLIIGCVLLGLAFVLSGLVPAGAPWLLYVTFSVFQGLGVGFTYTGATYCATGWYPDKRGLASGLCMALNGGSATFLAPLVVKLIDVAGITAAQVIKTRAYWHLFLGYGLFPTLYIICYPRFSVLISDAGYSVAAATLGVSLYSISNVLSRFLFGALIDKTGYRKVCTLCGVLCVAAAVCLMFASSLFMFYAAYVLLAFGIVLCMGGINASVFIVLMYPIALTIFEHCDIPKRFILGVLGACSYTFTLTMPGSPQVTNVAAMSALGTDAAVALVPGLVGAAVEIAVIIVLLNLLINRARARGEHFALHPLDPHYDENSPRPRFLVALLPLIVLFVLFNVVGLDINICIIISTGLSVIAFKDQLHGSSLRNLLSTGASESIHMSMTVAAICGFAGVVTETEAFTQMLNAIISIDISPMLICAIVVAVMCMLTGDSSTGQLISLPLIAPKLTELGLSVGAIHRIGCFAATTLDSLPYSGAILMLLPLCRMKLREVYPPLFVTTVIATTCGTAAVIITCALFPGLT